MCAPILVVGGQYWNEHHYVAALPQASAIAQKNDTRLPTSGPEFNPQTECSMLKALFDC